LSLYGYLVVHLRSFIFVNLYLSVFPFLRGRKGSGATTFMIISGATGALMDKDKKKAVEEIVERNAQKTE